MPLARSTAEIKYKLLLHCPKPSGITVFNKCMFEYYDSMHTHTHTYTHTPIYAPTHTHTHTHTGREREREIFTQNE